MTKKIEDRSDAMRDGVDPITGEVFTIPLVDKPFRRKFIRSAYDHCTGRDYSSPVGEESLTKQEFKDSVDMNLIVAHFTRTGRMDAFGKAEGMFLDMTEMPGSYQESLNMVNAAREAFMALPAVARAHFNNDVSLFLATAAHDPVAVFGERDESGRVVQRPIVETPPAPSEPQSEPTPSA